ncbi:MAG: YqaJ viral recombinase family protein [Alphaproteobacteria bacterium]
MSYTHKIVPITSEDQWLSLRKSDLTSTEISALFNLCPYLTKFELYHAKKDGLILPFKENERMKDGKDMEVFAANKVAKKNGWTVRPLQVYARIPELRLGASFDFEAICPKRGKGILEIKAVDYFRHKQKWSEEEIPPHIEIQARHQMLCAKEYNWSCVAAFTSIYDHHEYLFDRDEAFENGLIAASKSFWSDVDNGHAPEPDFVKDAAVISALYKNAGGEAVDLSADNQLSDLLAEYLRVKEEAKSWGDKQDALKSEIHFKMGERAKGFTPEYAVDTGWTKGSEGTVVTTEMVGTVIGAKSGYRKLLVKPYKGDKK